MSNDLDLTVAGCRERALAALEAADERYTHEEHTAAARLRDVAQFWATMSITAQEYAAPAPPPPPEGLSILGVELFSADSPEPDVNPGEVMVDPGGNGARFLLRLDGHKWLWCDSLAEAEASELKDAGTWSKAMGCGIIRVRRATERESIEFRNGTGGAALDLVRRLLATLAGLARDSGHEHTARWLADCDEHAHLSFHTWQWPLPPPAIPPVAGTYVAAGTAGDPDGEKWAAAADKRADRHQTIPPGVLTDLAHAPGRAIHYGDSPVLVSAFDDGSVRFSAPVHWFPATKNDPVPDRRRDLLTVRVENPQPDLARLNGATLVRLRDQIQALITERVRTDTKVAGTRPRGGASQWREG